MTKTYNIAVWQEWKFYVTRVLENNVSSFGKTYEEALEQTKEALELYNEDDELGNSFTSKIA